MSMDTIRAISQQETHPDPEECICKGSGWWLSPYDSWHQCSYTAHRKGNEAHPEDYEGDDYVESTDDEAQRAFQVEEYDWCPGNGARYLLVFFKKRHGFFLAWTNRDSGGVAGPCIDWDGITITPGELQRRLNHPEWLMGDMTALCAFLHSRGCDAELPPGFTSEGRVESVVTDPPF